MNRTNMKAFSSAIANAALSRRSALQLELAVGFAVHIECGQAKRLTRALLCEIYSGAGYKANAPGDLDWKSINRRITAALALFDFLGAADIAKWIEGKTKTDLLNAIVVKLEPMKLKSINEVLEVCGKVGARAPRTERPEPEGTHHVDTENIHVTVPPEATADELMEVAMAIMDLAKQAAATAVTLAAAAMPANAEHAHDPEPVAA